MKTKAIRPQPTPIVHAPETLDKAAAKRAKIEEDNRQVAAEIAEIVERKARRAKDAKDWEEVRKLASDWSEAARLRCFLEDMAVRLKGVSDADGHGRAWLDWALTKTEELDPLGSGSQLILAQMLKGYGLRRWRVRHADEEIYEYWSY